MCLFVWAWRNVWKDTHQAVKICLHSALGTEKLWQKVVIDFSFIPLYTASLFTTRVLLLNKNILENKD